MRRVITGATGLIGKHLTERWLKQNHEVIAVGRSEAHIKATFGSRVQAITWDRLMPEHLESAELVVNLAGASVGDERWTDARKQEIVDSRLQTTKQLADLLATLGQSAPPLFNASAIGIYGLQQPIANGLPVRLDENTFFDWNHPPDFLSFVARHWEKAADPAIEAGVRVVFLRFGVVLAKEGGALSQIIKPFRFYLGGPLGTGQQPFSWIALDDVLLAIDFLLSLPDATGPFNLVSPECVTQRVFAKTLGKVMHRPANLTMPAMMLKLMLGKDMARELLLEGQHVYPKRLLDLNFQFHYSHLESALNHILR